jgi:hypothetical protein
MHLWIEVRNRSLVWHKSEIGTRFSEGGATFPVAHFPSRLGSYRVVLHVFDMRAGCS